MGGYTDINITHLNNITVIQFGLIDRNIVESSLIGLTQVFYAKPPVMDKNPALLIGYRRMRKNQMIGFMAS